MSNSLFVIERARPEEATELLDYLKIVGGETDNLSFGAEGVPLSLEAEQEYLRAQCGSTDNVQYFAKVDGEIIGTASLNRNPNRMSEPSWCIWNQSEKSMVGLWCDICFDGKNSCFRQRERI